MKKAATCHPTAVLAAAMVFLVPSTWAADPMPLTWAEAMLAAREKCIAVAAAKDGTARKAPPFKTGAVRGDGPAQHIAVDVSGQSWLHVKSTEEGGGNCHIWGEAKLVAADGTETRLVDLEPAHISVGWGQLLKDKNWQNRPLKIGDRTFAHGIWVHAASDVVYPLGGKYARFESWVGMDADRARGTAWFEVAFDRPDLAKASWQKLQREFPASCRSFRGDLQRGDAYLAWFQKPAGTRTEETIIGGTLATLQGDGAALGNEFQDLRQQRAPADDPRWLSLYARACRYRDCRDAMKGIRLAELRRGLEAARENLLRVNAPAEDPRWDRLTALAKDIAIKTAAAPAMDTATIAPAVKMLCDAMPERFSGTAPHLRTIEEKRPLWQGVFAGAVSGDAGALAQLPSVTDDIRALRHGLILGITGMGKFLASPGNTGLEAEWEREFESLLSDLANRGHFQKVANEAFHKAALILDQDRDPADVVIRRTEALLLHLQQAGQNKQAMALAGDVAMLKGAAQRIAAGCAEARYLLFVDACRTRRAVAFANPRLDFDDILFIKRHRAAYNHMCDQYYGMAAMPGGGLYVLSNAFGEEPRLRDVLAGSVLRRGRLAGKGLSGGPAEPRAVSFDGMGNRSGDDGEGGCFLSPDLSFDGTSVAFAYVECDGDTQHRHHTDPTRGHWAEGRCYHIFSVGIDGSGLEQLTDGTWNDFDPCWMPDGRIAFITERRGGYLRCGRACPNYTLYDMAADGRDIRCLSFHETNEWHPSVTNHGLLIWTRWDYVDRHGCTAHHPWTITPDGRDPRSIHGNFAPRHIRPDMELDVRAIPDSPKYIATAAPHHGQAYGSIVIIDPRIPDDDAMGPVRRVTPEVGFPESQGGGQVYGTPWPLDENFYLCVYDPDMQPDAGRQGQGYRRGEYGIYLADAFGNKELLYRDPAISCLSPMPVKGRPVPPRIPQIVLPDPATDPVVRPTLDAKREPAEATVAIMNIYNSLKPWPEGTRITDVRVLQVLPMTVPSGSIRPHETAIREASSRDSVVPVRYVLGTAPVEKDGSAFFRVPANREIFFQAIDDKGMAVQSMRSATQLHAGETLSCGGCHDRRHEAPSMPGPRPLALRRAPSRLKPDVDGTNPFSYPRLVQPVLDRHCVPCHSENVGKAPNLAREPYHQNWYASYNTLVNGFAFHDYGNPHRTTPGEFGARASKLFRMLQQGHHDVRLPQEDLHRITLWLDCASLFYGVYEKEGGEAQLRGNIVRAAFE